MKKFLLILFLFLALPTFAETVLYGEAEYSVKSARDLVSDGIVYRINPTTYSNELYDADNQSNLQNIIDGNLNLKDRTLAFFSDSSYGVMYLDNQYEVYYYSAEGVLLYIDKKSSLDYPYKVYKYSPTGELVNMGLRVSKAETYIYSPSKKLIAHWIGNTAYDENNNAIMKRKYSE